MDVNAMRAEAERLDWRAWLARQSANERQNESSEAAAAEGAGGGDGDGKDDEKTDPVSAALLEARIVRSKEMHGRAAPRCALTWLPIPAAGPRPWVCRVCGRRYSRSTETAAAATAGGGASSSSPSPVPCSVVGGSHAGAPSCVVCGVLVSPLVSSMGLSRPALP